jgi:hypothetical protein
VKRQGIGHPREALKQFRSGTLFKPGSGLIANGLPRSKGEIAAMLALPLIGSVMSAQANPEIGGGEIAGDFAGRTVGSLLGAPTLGAAGQLGGSMLLAPVGRAVGKAFDSSHSPAVAPDA